MKQFLQGYCNFPMYVLLLVSLLDLNCVFSQIVNVALRKPISAYATCGEGRSDVFTTHDQIYLPPTNRKNRICSSPLDHPASNMNDGDPDHANPTFWLSAPKTALNALGLLTGNVPESAISIDLGKVSQSRTRQLGRPRSPANRFRN